MHNETTIRKLRVVKGNRRIGIRAHQCLKVIAVTQMGPEFSHQVRVLIRHPDGRARALWAQHKNRLNDPQFNLGNGSGVDKIRVQVGV